MSLEFKRSWGDEEVERFRDSWVRVSKARWCTTRWRSAPARVCRARVVAAGRRTRLAVRRHPRMGRRRRRFRGGAARGDGASRAERHEHRGTFDRRPLFAEPRRRRPEAPLSATPRSRRWSARSRCPNLAPDRISRPYARAPSAPATNMQSMGQRPSFPTAILQGWWSSCARPIPLSGRAASH
jgi:hypothetical protein